MDRHHHTHGCDSSGHPDVGCPKLHGQSTADPPSSLLPVDPHLSISTGKVYPRDIFIPGVPHVPPTGSEGIRDQPNLLLSTNQKTMTEPGAEPVSVMFRGGKQQESIVPPIRHGVSEQGAAQPCHWYLAGSLAFGSWVGFRVSLLLCMAGAGTTQKISARPVKMIHPSQSCLLTPHLLEPPRRNDSPSPSH